MHFSILKLVVIAVASAFGAAFAMFRHAFDTGEDPSDDGPRALIAEFLGLWIGFSLLTWSFFADGRTLQWTLRGAAGFVVLLAAGLSTYFASTTEVPETPDEEPTGFKNDSTDLHLG
jgi:hypothetical protein